MSGLSTMFNDDQKGPKNADKPVEEPRKKKKQPQFKPDFSWNRFDGYDAKLYYEKKSGVSYPCKFTIFTACWCPDGSVVLAGGGGNAATGMAGGAQLCRVERVPEVPGALGLRGIGVCSVGDEMMVASCVHPTLPRLVLGVDDMIYDCQYSSSSLAVSNKIKGDHAAEMPLISALSFSPNGQLLACGGSEFVIRLFKYPSYSPYKIFDASPHTAPVAGISFSPHGLQ